MRVTVAMSTVSTPRVSTKMNNNNATTTKKRRSCVAMRYVRKTRSEATLGMEFSVGNLGRRDLCAIEGRVDDERRAMDYAMENRDDEDDVRWMKDARDGTCETRDASRRGFVGEKTNG